MNFTFHAFIKIWLFSAFLISLNSKIDGKILSNGGATCFAKVWDTPITFDSSGNATVSGSTIKQATGMSGISNVICQLVSGNSGFISRATVVDVNSNVEIKGLTNSGGVLSGSVNVTMLVIGTP